MKKTNEEFKQYENMINKIAWSFNTTTGIPLEELQSAAYELYAKALDKFDVDKGNKFSTYLHTCCTLGLINFCKYEGREYYRPAFDHNAINVSIAQDLLQDMPVYDRGIDLKRIIKQMSAEAQGVVDILFNCPDELLSLVKCSKNSRPHNIKLALKRFLKGLHWDDAKITKTFNELGCMVAGL